MAECWELVSSTCCCLSLSTLILKTTRESCRGDGQRSCGCFCLSGDETAIVWVKGLCSEAKNHQLWLQASLHINHPLPWGVGPILVLDLSSWGSFSSLYLMHQCQVLPFPSKGLGTQRLGSRLPLLGWVFLLPRQDCFRRAAFRNYPLNTPGWGTGFSSEPHNQDHRKGALIFLLLHSSEHVLNGMYF